MTFAGIKVGGTTRLARSLLLGTGKMGDALMEVKGVIFLCLPKRGMHLKPSKLTNCFMVSFSIFLIS